MQEREYKNNGSLAGINTFDLTYNPEVAAEINYDDKDRYANRADMNDTMLCDIKGKLEIPDKRERRDGPGGN